MQPCGVGVLYFSYDVETAISQSVPATRALSRRPKDGIGGLEAYPNGSVTYMSWHLAMLACECFNWPVTRKELRQRLTFEEV
jgi:hypothetical protein